MTDMDCDQRADMPPPLQRHIPTDFAI